MLVQVKPILQMPIWTALTFPFLLVAQNESRLVERFAAAM